MLRNARRESGLNQREVAERLGETTLYVSRCERGERRMDVVELLAYCRAIGRSPHALVKELESLVK